MIKGQRTSSGVGRVLLLLVVRKLRNRATPLQLWIWCGYFRTSAIEWVIYGVVLMHNISSFANCIISDILQQVDFLKSNLIFIFILVTNFYKTAPEVEDSQQFQVIEKYTGHSISYLIKSIIIFSLEYNLCWLKLQIKPYFFLFFAGMLTIFTTNVSSESVSLHTSLN